MTHQLPGCTALRARPARAGRSYLRVGASIAAVALVAAACGSAAPGSGAQPSPSSTRTSVVAPVAASAQSGIPSFYTPPNPLPAGRPGALIRTQEITGVPGVPSGAKVIRVLYHSRSIAGRDIAESGFVVVPPGPVPKGGRPVLSWAHGTTGTADICAPSLLEPSNFVYLVPGLSAFLQAGYVVAATDYEGLGTPGVHPYLLGESEGRSVLDAARAARQLPGAHAGAATLIYGHSQGGQAALFAGELAPSYAPELDVKGVAAAAPATNLSLIVAAANTPLAKGAIDFELMAAWTWSQTYRDLPASDLLTPRGIELARTLTSTVCDAQINQQLRSQGLTNADLFVPTVATDQVVAQHARLNDPGRVRTPAPILVVQGTADTTVPPFLTDDYVAKMACPIGDTIQYDHIVGASHGTVPVAALPVLLSWASARLVGTPAPTTCGAPNQVATVTP